MFSEKYGYKESKIIQKMALGMGVLISKVLLLKMQNIC